MPPRPFNPVAFAAALALLAAWTGAAFGAVWLIVTAAKWWHG